MTTPRIVTSNVVATFNLGIPELKVHDLLLRVPEAGFSTQFLAAMLRLTHRRPNGARAKTAALIFDEGQVVCAGGKTVPEALFTCHRYAAYLRRNYDPSVQMCNFQVRNIVANADMGVPLDLEGIYQHMGPDGSCELALFTGVRVKRHNPKVTVNCFRSGCLNITGHHCEAALQAQTDELIQTILHRYAEPHAAPETRHSNVYYSTLRIKSQRMRQFSRLRAALREEARRRAAA